MGISKALFRLPGLYRPPRRRVNGVTVCSSENALDHRGLFDHSDDLELAATPATLISVTLYQAWRQSVRRQSDTPPDGLDGQRRAVAIAPRKGLAPCGGETLI